MDCNHSKIIKLRPHHGLCIQNFIGKGYSEGFVENMRQVIRQLENKADREIRLSVDCDVICAHCPHNHNGICKSGQKVESFDKTCLSLCGLEEGEILGWQEFKRMAHENILACGKLKLVCQNCEWLDICSPPDTR